MKQSMGHIPCLPADQLPNTTNIKSHEHKKRAWKKEKKKVSLSRVHLKQNINSMLDLSKKSKWDYQIDNHFNERSYRKSMIGPNNPVCYCPVNFLATWDLKSFLLAVRTISNPGVWLAHEGSAGMGSAGLTICWPTAPNFISLSLRYCLTWFNNCNSLFNDVKGF